jgi:transcription elongation factor Elf1
MEHSAKHQPYAFYTRYPEGIAEGRWAEDLICPSCGAEEIVILKEWEFAVPGMLGDTAQCWICKLTFQITENCWVVRRMYSAICPISNKLKLRECGQ